MKEAFCEWNAITGGKLEVLDECPFGTICSPIKYESIDLLESTGSLALAAGLTSTNPFFCNPTPVVSGMEIIFSSDVDWNLNASVPTDNVIKTAALYEIGHLFQLKHSYNSEDLMFVLYSNNSQILSNADNGGSHVCSASTANACPENLRFELGTIVDCTTSAKEVEEEELLSVYPNPTTGIVYIDSRQFFGLKKYEVISYTGKVIEKRKFNIDGVVDISHLLNI